MIRNLAIATAAILPCQLDDVSREPLLVVATPRRLALCRAVLTEHRTGAALGEASEWGFGQPQKLKATAPAAVRS